MRRFLGLKHTKTMSISFISIYIMLGRDVPAAIQSLEAVALWLWLAQKGDTRRKQQNPTPLIQGGPPTRYLGYNSYNYGYNPSYLIIRPSIGVITPFITGRGPSCRLLTHPRNIHKSLPGSSISSSTYPVVIGEGFGHVGMVQVGSV